MLEILRFFLRKKSFSYLLLAAFVLFGVYAVNAIPKESAPEVQVPMAIVTTAFPGASAVDVERLVTNKIEERLASSLTDLESLTSTSREGVSSVMVEFNASADIKASIDEVKEEIDVVKSDLPEDAADPIVSEINFSDQPILLVSVTSDLPVTEFITLSEEVESELESIQGVSRVEKSGVPEREVQVIVNKDSLSAFGLRLNEVVAAVAAANSAVPAGEITVDDIEYAIQFEGSITDPGEIRDISIPSSSGEPVYLRDIAFVSDGVSETRTVSRVSVGGAPSEQSVSFSVYKKRGGDILEIADNVEKKMDSLEETILSDAQVLISFSDAEYIKDDLENLSMSGLQTVLLVMIILFITLGFREAVIAGFAIPLSFLIAFGGLWLSGNTINFISLFSLILSVGILVDAAIVVTEAIHTKMREGLGRREAAVESLRDYLWPLIAGTMTTIMAFAPLFFISGVTGEFIASIPFTVITVLLASLFVALAIIPLLASSFLKEKEGGSWDRRQEEYTRKLQAFYRKRLDAMLGSKSRQNLLMTGVVVAFFATIAFPAIGFVNVIFFPGEDFDFLFIDIEKPQGTVLGETDIVARGVEEILYEDDRVESFITNVGSASSFGSGGGSGSRLANVTVILKEDREETTTEIMRDFRERFREIGDAEISVFQAESGPPVGDPVAVKFFGDDLEDLERTVVIGERVLKDVPGTTEVGSSMQGDVPEFSLEIDRAKTSAVGLTPLEIAQTLRTAVHGTKATTIKNDEGDIDVVVKLNLNSDYRDPHDTARVTLDAVRLLELETPRGSVLLGSLVDVGIKKGNAVIRHEDRKRIATVSSDILPGSTVQQVTSVFEEKLESWGLPEGVSYTIGGETEESNQSFQEMGMALAVGIIFIIALLVLQFNSFRQAFFIVAIVPVALIGIMVGLALTREPLSFPSLMGYIALTGIVVNNSIILIDVINNLRKQGVPLKEAILDGSVTRLRPIFLTTLTTVIGIVPLTYASDIWAPLAYSIIFGLSFATFFTVVLVPIFSYRWPVKDPDLV